MNTQALDIAAKKMRNLDWTNREVYKEFIAQVYYFVCHSTRMLGSAMSQTTNEKYYDRLVAHISEENKHEKLALKDLQNLGGSLADYPEMGVTRAMWETQFYKIGKSPESLLGYILALELIATRVYPEIFDSMVKQYGQKCMNFIRVHNEEDPDHVEKAASHLDSLKGMDHKLAVENFEQTSKLLAVLFDEISSRSEQRSNPRKGTRAA